MLTRNDPAGSHTYTWNKLNQLTTATDPLSASTISYAYNLAGQATQVQYGTAPAATRTYTYKPTGWLDTDTFKNNAGTTTMSASYTYDKNGSVTREVLTLPGNTAAGTYDYAYDRSDRLVSFARTASRPSSTAGTTLATARRPRPRAALRRRGPTTPATASRTGPKAHTRGTPAAPSTRSPSAQLSPTTPRSTDSVA